MSLVIDKEFFELAVSSAAEASGEVFVSLQSYLTDATAEATAFLGELLTAELSQDIPEDEPLYYTAETVRKWICLRAYENAIPHLDLVLTPTGFGIVSNQNTAPASADRVNRLLVAVRNAKDDAFDNLLDRLRGDDRWCDTGVAQMLFSSLFWRASHLTRYGVASPHRTRLNEYRKTILLSEAKLKDKISPQFYQELCDCERFDNCNSFQLSAITLCRNVIAMPESSHHRKLLLSFLHDNIDEFPTYKNSSAYEANTFTPHQNTKDDACFFF